MEEEENGEGNGKEGKGKVKHIQYSAEGLRLQTANESRECGGASVDLAWQTLVPMIGTTEVCRCQGNAGTLPLAST